VARPRGLLPGLPPREDSAMTLRSQRKPARQCGGVRGRRRAGRRRTLAVWSRWGRSPQRRVFEPRGGERSECPAEAVGGAPPDNQGDGRVRSSSARGHWRRS
jgi:hypothetical protein